MTKEIDLSSLDLRYEGHRMKNPGLEERLLASIAQRGIQEPLEGVQREQANILLNGFKRYRCAHELQLRSVPYASLGEEQAAFIDELYASGCLSVAEMAKELSRSKSWVSMRLGLIAEMSAAIRAKLFSGAFPVYSYMYTLRQFMRMNGVSGQDVEQFVAAVSDKGLSIRDIEQLAHGYFRGPESLRQEIVKGNLALPLKRLREASQNPDGCSDFERATLRDLELTHKYMQRLIAKSQDPRLKSRPFHAQANLLTAAILSRAAAFNHNLRHLLDRSGQA
jgi:hypothetical protein